MKIDNEKINKCADEMFIIAKDYFESTDHIKENFNLNKEKISTESIDFCIGKFVHSELDFKTPGNRGLGRTTDYWPRLGSYFKSGFKKLKKEDLEKLDHKISNLMLKAYLFTIIISNEDLVKNNFDKERLFQKWIPKIYTFDLSVMGENTADFLWALVIKDYNNIKTFFRNHSMEPGFFSKDKTELILNGYVIGGLVLRVVEKQ